MDHNTFYDQYDFKNKDVSEKLIECIYFAVTSLSTLGLGDRSP